MKTIVESLPQQPIWDAMVRALPLEPILYGKYDGIQIE